MILILYQSAGRRLYVHACVLPSAMFLLNVSPAKALDKTTSNFEPE